MRLLLDAGPISRSVCCKQYLLGITAGMCVCVYVFACACIHTCICNCVCLGVHVCKQLNATLLLLVL